MAKPKIERLEAYKKYKMELHEAMLQKQRVPYSIKRKMSEDRIRSFYKEATARGYNCHVSVGGLDSIVLCYLIREIEEKIWLNWNGSLMIHRVMRKIFCKKQK